MCASAESPRNPITQFAPVREAGGYGALLKVPDAPGMEKARELKEIQKAKRQELIQNLQGGAP